MMIVKLNIKPFHAVWLIILASSCVRMVVFCLLNICTVTQEMCRIDIHRCTSWFCGCVQCARASYGSCVDRTRSTRSRTLYWASTLTTWSRQLRSWRWRRHSSGVTMPLYSNISTCYELRWLLTSHEFRYQVVTRNVRPVWGWGTPLPPCPFTSSYFPPFYFSLSFIGFTYFLLLSIPSLSTRIVPLRFQAGGRRRRPNLSSVCVLLCNLCYLYSLVMMNCGVLFYLV